jgi:hypothetical protein
MLLPSLVRAKDLPQPIGQEMTLSLAGTEVDDVLTIPMKRVGNLFFIEGTLDGLTGNFLFDLGATDLVLNEAYFRDYEEDRTYASGTLTSSKEFIRKTAIRKLEVHGMVYTDLTVNVTNLADIENKRGLKVLGLLGVSLLDAYSLEIDVLQQTLILYKERIDEPENAFLTVPLSINNHVVTVQTTIGQTRLRLSLDSAAELNIFDNRLPPKIYEGMKILKALDIVDADGNASEALMTLMPAFEVEGLKFPRMRSMVLNLRSMSRAYGQPIDGMLGYPFFACGRVIIDFRSKKLYLCSFNNTTE